MRAAQEDNKVTMGGNTEAEVIYGKFLKQLEKWSTDGDSPSSADQDICYFLELQRERLKSRNVKMEYRMAPRGHFASQQPMVTWRDAKYTNRMVYGTCRKEVRFEREGKTVYSKKEPEIFYQIITWLNDVRAGGQETYCCPNCGALSPVRQLLEGCPYCGTRFLLPQLFPRVTNFYFLRDHGLDPKEAKGKIRQWTGGGAVVMALFGLVSTVFSGITAGTAGMGSLLAALPTLIGYAAAGALFGYFALSFSLIGGLFKDAAKTLPFLPKVMGTKRKLTGLMQQFDPEFSYDYFVGQVLSVLKILIYSPDISKSVVYEGNGGSGSYWDILDAVYMGGIALNGSRFEDGYCYLDLNVYMQDIHDGKKRIRRRTDVFRLVLCKNISRLGDRNFSIRRAQCKSCGASFDATRIKTCPYCQTPYRLREDGWAVMEVRLVN